MSLKNSSDVFYLLYLLSPYNSSPRWRFFKSELNFNEHLAKSTHDLGEIDTRSRLGQQTKPVPSKWNASTYTIDFHWSYQIHIEFVVPSGNAIQTPISIIRFQLQLNYPNGMQHTCLPNTPRKRNTVWADNERVYNSAIEWKTILNDLKKNWTWANIDSPTDWLSSPNVFKMVQPNLSRAHQTPSSASINGCIPSYASLTISHQKINCSSRSQCFTSTWSPQSASQEPKQLHIGCITKCGCAFTAAYVPCPRIKPIVSS